jgi:hypothetical protein
LRQVPDGAGAKAEQDTAGIGGVALKIPAQPSLAKGHGHCIIGEREVVEPDLQISGLLQCAGDRIGLVMPFETVGQPGRIYLALVLLECRDMRVAEHGKAIGAKLDALADGVET